ncbi:MAG: hypothetical protein ABL929_12245 [Ferruginibacter sp.]
MSKPKLIIVKESHKELIQLRKSSSDSQSKRLLMLIELKKERGVAVSKRDLAIRIGVDPGDVDKSNAKNL